MANLTSNESRALAAAISALGATLTGGAVVTACSVVYEDAPKNPDGSYTGEIVKMYHVEVTGKILGKNHTAVRTLTSAADPATVVAEIQKDLKKQAKEANAKAKFQPERIR